VYQRDCDSTRIALVNGWCDFWKTHPKFIFLRARDCVPHVRLSSTKCLGNLHALSSRSLPRKTLLTRKGRKATLQASAICKKYRRMIGEDSITEWVSQARLQQPRAESREPRAESRELGAGSWEPEAWSLIQKSNAVRASHPNRIHKRKSCFCLFRALCRFHIHALQRFCSSGFSSERCFRTQGAFASPIVLSGVQSRHARPFLRRPQRPGCPQRLHVSGTARQSTRTAHRRLFSSTGRRLPFTCRRTSLARSLAAQPSRLQ
jgi:hypothetical protein